jgi:hypothetical protein
MKGLAQTIGNVLLFLRARIVRHPDARIVILVRNDATTDQFEAGEVPHAEMPAFLRRAADTIERDARAGAETIKGSAVGSKSIPAGVDLIYEHPKKRN